MRIIILTLLMFTYKDINATPSKTYFISKYGSEYKTCQSGEGYQWKTLKKLKTCLNPGDTVIFKEGKYSDNELSNGDLGINKVSTSKTPVYIKSESIPGNPWPVKLYGDGFNITIGGAIDISGIEFEKKNNSSRSLIAIGINNVSISNSLIHGDVLKLDDLIKNPSMRKFDCIFAPANKNDVSNIIIKNNIIKNCTQDAIDLPGSKNVTITGNDISRSMQIQIKGGAENILINNNNIYETVFGVVGGTMKCSFYCGAPGIPQMPVENRFNAKNVVISNNVFSNIAGNWIVNFTGWVDSIIDNNEINQLIPTSKQEIFASKNWSSQFFDDKAIEYCKINADDCESCQVMPSNKNTKCVSIIFQAKNVLIKNNYVDLNNQAFARIYSPLNKNVGFCMNNTNTINKAGKIYKQYSYGKKLLEEELSADALQCK